jgi:hypothetical protein
VDFGSAGGGTHGVDARALFVLRAVRGVEAEDIHARVD